MKENIQDILILLVWKKVVLCVSRVTLQKLVSSGHAILVMKDPASPYFFYYYLGTHLTCTYKQYQ